MAEASQPKIFVSFRFHGNFYHSYRGDTPDELGFGKDIRIIRRIIEILDDFNKQGINVCGTWDYENFFSLETIMPQHSPDIIESIQRRVKEGKDEIELMSYNNGMVSTHTAKEFEAVIRRTMENNAKSGVKDIFGEFFPLVRPQEMMFTPIHLKLYKKCGVDCISLFYSGIPFNGFSNFLPVLPFEQRYNPLTLTYPGIEETLILFPAYNIGDIADNISLRGWIKRLRKKQMSMEKPIDILLLIDHDADDEFWYGTPIPVIKHILSSAKGLKGIVNVIKDLPYVEFTTPGRYLQNHKPVGTISFGQDTADGSFDGYSSWAEKWSNHQLWTGIERSRIMELQALRLLEGVKKKEIKEEANQHLKESFEYRVKAMSSTHFGLSSPVMNKNRLAIAKNIVASSLEHSWKAFDLVCDDLYKKEKGEDIIHLMDYNRGVSTSIIEYHPSPSKTLIRLPMTNILEDDNTITLLDNNKNTIPCAYLVTPKGDQYRGEVLFVESMEALQEKQYSIRVIPKSQLPDQKIDNGVWVDDFGMGNEMIRVQFDANNQLELLQFKGEEFSATPFVNSAITYNKQKEVVDCWEMLQSEVIGQGLIGIKRMRAVLPVKSDRLLHVEIEREILIASTLPYLYITMSVKYPKTEFKNYKEEHAKRLATAYDARWEEVIPCEVSPSIYGTDSQYLKIWKHNYLNHVSHYELNYGSFSKNKELDSFNNHITNGWVGVSNGEKGLLLAQSADYLASFAFCPMRLRKINNKQHIFLNPFGSYFGNQLDYQTAYSGLGKKMAVALAVQYDPYAPSYNGKQQLFSLMLAPYKGDEPPNYIQNDAKAFAYPYMIRSNSQYLEQPFHRFWKMDAWSFIKRVAC